MKKNNWKLCLINKCTTFITYAKPGSRLGLSFVNRTPNPFSKPCECNAQEPPKWLAEFMVMGIVSSEPQHSGRQDGYNVV